MTTKAGDVLVDRYRLVDLLSETPHGRFWRAHDRILERHVALHVIPADDERADLLLEAARRSATVQDPRFLRVLDAERTDTFCFVVNEWGSGTSLDIMLATHGPLAPREAAWMVAEVADSVATAHARAVPHGRLVPENVLVDNAGGIRIIGFCVDAALHGLPPGELRTDVRDLAGLLHAALTGKWAGDSASQVPPVPRDHGRVLRPRQVRAGVPRPLDDLCDELLNPQGKRVRDVRDIASARGICVFLTEFVGDDNGLAATIAGRLPDRSETVTLPFVPDIMARPDDVEMPPVEGPEPVDADDGRAEPDDADVTGTGDAVGDLPTQAGLPIFDDATDDVSWLEKRRDPPPPPPPFEEPPARPLFAPDDGGRRRQGSPLAGPYPSPGGGHRGPKGDEFWPGPGQGSSSGSGSIPAYVDDDGPVDTPVPGRRALRWAGFLGAALLVLVILAIAFNLSRGRTPLGGQQEDDPTSTPTLGTPTASSGGDLVTLEGVTADDFDPEGDPPEENPDDTANAVDGDPGTSWSTSTYQQQLGPGGLKSGVGLLLDLGTVHEVDALELDLVGDGTAFEVFLADERPTDVTGLTAAGQDELPGGAVGLTGARSGRFLVVWLTALPPTDDGRFRGEVVDLRVLATP
ncbi:protein kinase family protein [Nocardioides sp.]|uniref:protein kinase family protein n=1 Tax=Nocardioides sp. TaxID=35761 RepID=UPI001A2A3EFB|nr:protein kinase family protein [Nocardioides sp.]MBJ7357576.1 protein kinase family protein [Nocardioides sp.]